LERLRLTTLETRRKRGDLIQFFKVLNGHDHIKWKNEPKKIVLGDNNGPASRNLRRGGGRVSVFGVNLRIYVHPGMSFFLIGLFLFGTNYHKK
jgi:hypothetical protein